MPDTTLNQKLAPTHLFPDSVEPEEDLRKGVEKATTDADPSADNKPPEDDPRHEKEYTFKLDFTDGRGKKWKGTFTTKILSLAERQRVGVLRSQFQGGAPLESFDQFTADLNMQISHMMYSLVQRPKWAENLRSLDDPGVAAAIWEEVASHEAFFLGWGSTLTGGAKES